MKVRLQWKSPQKQPPPVPITEPVIIDKLMIEAFGVSDAGCVRNNNEDYFLVAPSLGLYLVADGMGGAQAGEHASKLASETVCEVIYTQAGNATGDTLVEAFEEANRRVMETAAADPSMEGMGTTLVAALELGADLLIASVGDSRAYIYENGAFSAITEDQTWVNEVGRRLGIDEESLKQHPMRHVLTMAIGVSEQLRVHTYMLHPTPGTQILLCCDGVHGVVPEEEMGRILASANPLEDKCRQFIEAARGLGGPDNITVVLLSIPPRLRVRLWTAKKNAVSAEAKSPGVSVPHVARPPKWTTRQPKPSPLPSSLRVPLAPRLQCSAPAPRFRASTTDDFCQARYSPGATESWPCSAAVAWAKSIAPTI